MDAVYVQIPKAEFEALRADVSELKDTVKSIPAERPSDSGWLTQDELQQLLDCSRSTLHRLRREGKIVYSQIGRKILFRREDVDAFLEDHLQAA